MALVACLGVAATSAAPIVAQGHTAPLGCCVRTDAAPPCHRQAATLRCCSAPDRETPAAPSPVSSQPPLAKEIVSDPGTPVTQAVRLSVAAQRAFSVELLRITVSPPHLRNSVFLI